MDVNNDLSNEISMRLKEARETKGLSRYGLSKLIGVPHTTLFQHENGQRTITVQAAVLYCEALNISLNWLVYGKD